MCISKLKKFVRFELLLPSNSIKQPFF